jgi:hypothetical protein
MVLKLLLLAGFLWLGYRVLTAARRLQKPGPSDGQPRERFEPMGQCRRCGIHAPRASLSVDGYCGRCSG